MPTVAWFYGIAIAMYYNDHSPPHFHAQYGQSRAVIGIADRRVIAGSLPPTALRLVTAPSRTRTELGERPRRCAP